MESKYKKKMKQTISGLLWIQQNFPWNNKPTNSARSSALAFYKLKTTIKQPGDTKNCVLCSLWIASQVLHAVWGGTSNTNLVRVLILQTRQWQRSLKQLEILQVMSLRIHKVILLFSLHPTYKPVVHTGSSVKLPAHLVSTQGQKQTKRASVQRHIGSTACVGVARWKSRRVWS